MTKINISSEQIRAIQAYVNSSTESLIDDEKIESLELPITGFTYQLNAILRSNLQLSSKVNQYLRVLDDAFLNHQTLESQIVYRGCNYQEMLRYLMNENYIDHGYMSTSKSIGGAERFLQNLTFGYKPAFLLINIPVQSNVLDLETINQFDNTTYEGEILFKQKSLFKVIENKSLSLKDLNDKFKFKFNSEYIQIQFLELNFIKNLD